MKKLLYYAPFVNRGGVRRVVESLLPVLADTAFDHGWSMEILATPWEENGAEIRYPTPIPFTPIEPNEEMPRHPKLFEALLRRTEHNLRHLAEVAPRFDLIYCPNPLWGTLGEWKFNTPLVGTIHDFAWDMTDMGEFLTNYYRASCANLARRMAGVMSMSKFQLDHAHAYGFRRYYQVRNSADMFASNRLITPEQIETTLRGFGIDRDYILLPHPMNTHGFDIGLRGYDIARNLFIARGGRGIDFPALVVCGIGTERVLTPTNQHDHEIYILIQTEMTAMLGRDILILGSVPDDELPPLFVGASMTLIPSKLDGDVNGSMFQAMVYGSPLIASDIIPFQERIGTTDTVALTFRSEDTLDLAGRIMNLLADRDAAEQRANQARTLANAYRLSDVANKFWSIFDEIIQNGGKDVYQTD